MQSVESFSIIPIDRRGHLEDVYNGDRYLNMAFYFKLMGELWILESKASGGWFARGVKG